MKIWSIFTAFSLFCCVLISFAHAQAPVISEISPTYGTVNEMITVRGSGFGTDPDQLTVFFGGALADSIVQVNETELQVLVPAGAASSSISVVNLATGLVAYSSATFTLSYDGHEFDKTNLEAPVTIDTEISGELYNFCVCDFNQDGLNDIVATNVGNSRASVLQNASTDVDGVSFVRPPTPNVDARGTRWVRCGDLNGDGRSDLIFTYSNTSTNKNRVAAYLNISAPGLDIAFEEGSDASLFTIEGDQGGRMVIRDLDGDGKPELTVADLNGRGGVSVFRNNSTSANIVFDADPFLPFAALGISPIGVSGVDAADFNGDGLPELVASNGSQNIHVLTNASSPGTISFSTALVVQSSEIQNVKTGDMDGDGKVDIVVSSKDHVGVFRNTTSDAEIAFAREAKFNTDGPKLLYLGLDLADMDGNGLPDVVFANEDVFPRMVTVVLNESSPGTLALNQSEKISTDRNRSVRARDFNGDGKPDLVYTHVDDNHLVVRLNRNCIQPVLEPKDGLGVCDLLPYQLAATQGVAITYQWEVSDDGINFLPLADAADSADTYTTSQERFFRVKVSSSHNGWDCSALVSNAVKVVRPDGFVPERPIILDPDPATPYCFGENVTIQTENINAKFIWTDPQGNVLPDDSTNVLIIEGITAEQAGAYTVYVQASPDQGGCISDVASTTILVSEPPAIQILADIPPVLLNEETTIKLSVEVAEGHTYAWTRDGQPVDNATGASLITQKAGNYVAVITNEQGCARESAPFAVANVQLAIPTTLCQNELGRFEITPDTLNTIPIRYRWVFGDGLDHEGPATNRAYARAGTYTVAIDVLAPDGSATGRVERTITVFALPELTIATEGKRHLCPGETVTLVGSEGFDSYAWNTGEATAALTVAEAGTYALTVTSSDGCSLTQEIEVRDVPNPEAVIAASTERVSLGDTLLLTASGGKTYRWSPATGLSDTTIANPIARPLVTTTYSCVVTTNDGCAVTAEYTIYVDRSLDVEPQKIFTPNYDGQNDTWLINKMELYPDCSMTLFNRQGVKIFVQENYSNDNPWNGTSNGQIVPAGVYFYLINCGDEAGQQTGSVTIVR